jgi:hypothetical protein
VKVSSDAEKGSLGGRQASIESVDGSGAGGVEELCGSLRSRMTCVIVG